MRPSLCTAVASATIPVPISFTWTLAAYDAGRLPTRVRVALRQQLFQSGVVSVDIVEEADFAVGSYYGCAVHDQHRNRLLEVHLQRSGAMLGFADAFLIPLRLVSENPQRQLFRFLDANAAMAEITP